MRRHRVFSVEPLARGRQVQLDANASRHLLQTLRLRPGDEIELFDGSGDNYSAVLLDTDKRSARAEVRQHLARQPLPALQLDLAIGVSRGERMDFGIQKAVELGIQHIAPLFTERSMVQLKGQRLSAREQHWQGVIRHACEQSGRARLPILHSPQRFHTWLGTFQGNGILLDHRAALALPDLPPPGGQITLLVGPEGGLSPAERTQAADRGLIGVRLGPRVLRTETAPLAALAVIQALWGDFRT